MDEGSIVHGTPSSTSARARRWAWQALGVSATVTLLWGVAVSASGLWPRVMASWPASITMVFGSIVAGSTPQGGGAVAYPVFTKALGMPSEVARTFSLCIQTVGMGTASIAIALNRRAVDGRAIVVGTVSAIVGFGIVRLLGDMPDLPFRPARIPSPFVKVTFTLVLLAMAYALWHDEHATQRTRHRRVPGWRPAITALVFGLGVLGGVVSGLVGSGADVLAYVALVVFLTLDPRVGVPTSVVIMACVSAVGFVTLGLIDGALFVTLASDDPTRVVAIDGRAVGLVEGRARYGVVASTGLPARSYDLLGLWLAAVPVVTWGAPFGSWLAAQLSARSLVRFIVAFAAIEVLSTALFVDELRSDPWLLTYAVLGTPLGLAAFHLVARHRTGWFGEPDGERT